MTRATAEERAIAFGILGGMPTYLRRWRDDVGHAANLCGSFGDPASPLIEEGEFVLSSELPEGSGYFRILRAIAAGHRTYGAIKTFADIDIQRQLDRLLALEFTERQTPVTEDPSRTKRSVYRIADNFLASWFRFVYPNRADIARGLGRHVVDRSILPNLSDHMGEPWEEICRGFLRCAGRCASTRPMRDEVVRVRAPVRVEHEAGRVPVDPRDGSVVVVPEQGRHGSTILQIRSRSMPCAEHRPLAIAGPE